MLSMGNKHSEDKKLIKRIAQGNKQAFEQLFRLYYPALVVYAQKFMINRDVSENIVQDLFVDLWEKRQKLKINMPSAYLYRSVKNRCINELKNKKYFTDLDKESLLFVEEDEEFDPELIVLVQNTIAKLPKQRQRIFIMSRYEGLKYKEIADKLGLSIKTVEAQMGKALKFLRKNLKEEIKKKNI